MVGFPCLCSLVLLTWCSSLTLDVSFERVIVSNWSMARPEAASLMQTRHVWAENLPPQSHPTEVEIFLKSRAGRSDWTASRFESDSNLELTNPGPSDTADCVTMVTGLAADWHL